VSLFGLLVMSPIGGDFGIGSALLIKSSVASGAGLGRGTGLFGE
jgi:hypothetical protein